jgi:hypothetical protein
MPIINRPQSILRIVLLALAIVCFAAAWYISLGNELLDSTNAGAFGYAGLAFGFGAFLP